MTRRGFTLIEALAVVSILGVLATLTVFAITQAQRQARDTKRKSDVAAISQAFEARAADRECDELNQSGLYPGNLNTRESSGAGTYPWMSVDLTNTASTADGCSKPLSTYLPTFPASGDSVYPYKFNLSTLDTSVVDSNGNGYAVPAKHYRVAASLEKQLTPTELAECIRQSKIWVTSFGGKLYDCEDSNAIVNPNTNPNTVPETVPTTPETIPATEPVGWWKWLFTAFAAPASGPTTGTTTTPTTGTTSIPTTPTTPGTGDTVTTPGTGTATTPPDSGTGTIGSGTTARDYNYYLGQ